MAQDGNEFEAKLAALGIPITAEGKRRARGKLDRADASRTPERINALRKKVGRPPLTDREAQLAAERVNAARKKLGMPPLS